MHFDFVIRDEHETYIVFDAPSELPTLEKLNVLDLGHSIIVLPTSASSQQLIYEFNDKSNLKASWTAMEFYQHWLSPYLMGQNEEAKRTGLGEFFIIMRQTTYHITADMQCLTSKRFLSYGRKEEILYPILKKIDEIDTDSFIKEGIKALNRYITSTQNLKWIYHLKEKKFSLEEPKNDCWNH
jgi:hypothetical protein